MPRAFITGITGQDGSYLAELLLGKGYEVHGLVRSETRSNWMQPLGDDAAVSGKKLFLHRGDLTDIEGTKRILSASEPDEVYHLAAQTHAGKSFELAIPTVESVAMVTVQLLEHLRGMKSAPRFFYASSSEIFGTPETSPQDEQTPFAPVNPYGAAKAFATQMVRIYRQRYGLHLANGIFYNHESPRRGEGFVTQKICRAAAAIKLGLESELVMGSVDAQRDWGDARDYVQGMWLALQAEQASDYIFATGKLHRVQDILDIAFGAVGLEWQKYMKQDPRFMRPTEPQRLLGNPAKAERELGWQRERTFEQTIREMTEAELARLSAK